MTLHTANEVTCHPASPDQVHFEKHCEDCDVRAMARMNLGDVEDRYRTGRISQDQYEAYMHVWAVLSPAGSLREWRTVPQDPTVLRIACKLREAISR